ncbi:IS3 family transposase [Limosilactobacillus ingluviei]|uniref:IS3 family transposase n=1 Tax=Limosilactobacillus ingluviei TaxID=148604 RepID=UPI0023F0A80F|nr:IS3 family transposase [Limosilactobacillus ingluviei]
MGVHFINRPLCKDLVELTQLSRNYICFSKHERTSLKTKGMTPVEYRNHTLIA